MQFLYLAAITFAIFLSYTGAMVSGNIDRPQAVISAKKQVDQYRVFMYAATQYMLTQSNPASVRTVQWSTIRDADSTPPGSKSLSMPLGWRVIQSTNGTWVACTELDERAIAAVGQMVAAQPLSTDPSVTSTPKPLATPIQVSIGPNDYVVLGDGATAPSLATICNT
jgi:hypothetical protein